MNAEIARKRPATVLAYDQPRRVEDAPPFPRVEYIDHRSEAELERLVVKLARRGELGRSYRIRATDDGWQAKVVRLRARRRLPRWTWFVLGGVALALGALWLLSILLAAVTAALAALLPWLAGTLLVLVLLGAIGGGAVSVSQNVTINR
jgi:hypothetical protein